MKKQQGFAVELYQYIPDMQGWMYVGDFIVAGMSTLQDVIRYEFSGVAFAAKMGKGVNYFDGMGLERNLKVLGIGVKLNV
jgi:phage terminase large subunit